MSITAWNGIAIIITEPENCRQRHCNERVKGETVSSSALETERCLGVVLRAGATAKKSGPDLAPDQEDLGPREKEVVMSAALVLLAGFAHLLRNTSGEASLGGGTPPSSFGQASHLQFFAETRTKSWAIGNSSRIWKEFAGAEIIRLIGAGS